MLQPYQMLFQKKAVCIQSYWRSFRCRKKVRFFSQLPDDIWENILDKLRQEFYECQAINKILLVRLIRVYWSPQTFHWKQKMYYLFLVRKYINVLKLPVLAKAQALCFKMLRRLPDTKTSLLINATLEALSNRCHANYAYIL